MSLPNGSDFVHVSLCQMTYCLSPSVSSSRNADIISTFFFSSATRFCSSGKQQKNTSKFHCNTAVFMEKKIQIIRQYVWWFWANHHTFWKNHQTFQFKYWRFFFRWSDQTICLMILNNHQTSYKIISNVWWADGFSWTLHSHLPQLLTTYAVASLWKGQECINKVAKFGPFPYTILYTSCLFYPHDRPPLLKGHHLGWLYRGVPLLSIWSSHFWVPPQMNWYSLSFEVIIHLSNKGGWQPNQGGTGVKDATKPVSVPALGPRQWSVGLAFAG